MIDIYKDIFEHNNHVDRLLGKMEVLDEIFLKEHGVIDITKKIYKIIGDGHMFDHIDNIYKYPKEDIAKRILKEFKMNDNIIKVSKSTSAKFLAGSILKEIEKYKQAKIRLVGAGALNQLVKAFIIGKQMVAGGRPPLSIDFFFEDIDIEGKTITSYLIIIK